jgi:hypothetical protein
VEAESNLTTAWLAKAKESLEAAQLLLSQQYFEDATSRAYYAMFAATKAALVSVGVETRSHSSLRSLFGQHFVKTGLLDAQFAKMLAFAFEARQSSDYSVSDRLVADEAKAILSDAEQFVATIKKLLSESHEPE